jgi:ferredoxin
LGFSDELQQFGTTNIGGKPRSHTSRQTALKQETMIRVDIESSNTSIIVTGDAEPLDRLVDVCDACRAPIEFACRSGTCGTCRVEVIEGDVLLQPPTIDEIETLAAFAAPPSHRLACRARLGTACDGRLRLRWAGDDP